MTRAVSVLIIGAGQAGLAAANALKTLGIEPLVIDRNARLGDSWRQRYRSLTLFTPRNLSALAGLAFSGDPDGYATGAEFADYLERYAGERGIAVTLGSALRDLSANASGGFVATLDSGESVEARAVILASGAFQIPHVPALARGFSGQTRQMTVADYRTPSDVPAGPVLVVGDGASGRDIAVDLVEGHQVALACGRPRRLLPERLLGASTWTWLRALGLMGASPNSPIGRIMRRADPFPNRQRDLDHLRGRGLDIRPRLSAVAGDIATFADGTSFRPASVVWALGYRDDFNWLNVPGAIAADGTPLHDGGRSPVPGIWYVGRPWQRNRASGLIMGASDDADIVARQVVASLQSRT